MFNLFPSIIINVSVTPKMLLLYAEFSIRIYTDDMCF